MKTISLNDERSHTTMMVRAGFVAQGSSLHAWCRQNGIDYHNARKALDGRWRGPKAEILVRQIAAAARAA